MANLEIPPISRRTAAGFTLAWLALLAVAAGVQAVASGFWVNFALTVLASAAAVLFASSGLGLVLDHQRRTRWRKMTTEMRLAAIDTVAADFGELFSEICFVLRPLFKIGGLEWNDFVCYSLVCVPTAQEVPAVTQVYATALGHLARTAAAALQEADEEGRTPSSVAIAELVAAATAGRLENAAFPEAHRSALDRLVRDVTDLCDQIGEPRTARRILTAVARLRVHFCHNARTLRSRAAVESMGRKRAEELSEFMDQNAELNDINHRLALVAITTLSNFAMILFATWHAVSAELDNEYLSAVGQIPRRGLAAARDEISRRLDSPEESERDLRRHFEQRTAVTRSAGEVMSALLGDVNKLNSQWAKSSR